MRVSDSFTLCPYSGKRIDLTDPAAVYEVEQTGATGFGPTLEPVDGRGGFFHPRCSREAVGYGRRPRAGP
jgi:hypothetical protein